MRPLKIVLSLIFVILLIFYSCCPISIKPKENLIWESPELKLKIKNENSDKITLLSVNLQKNLTLPIDSGDSTFICFRVYLYDVTYQKSSQNLEQHFMHRRIEACPETPFIFESGADYIAQIQFANGNQYPFLIEVMDSWFSDPPILERLIVIVNGPPLIGIPVN